MIGETSALVNQLNVDRIYKENIAKEQSSKTSSAAAEASAGNVTDTASFSPQALALAKQVAPVSESPAEEQTEMQQGKAEATEPGPDGFQGRFVDTQA